jgi:hypothetical protein
MSVTSPKKPSRQAAPVTQPILQQPAFGPVEGVSEEARRQTTAGYVAPVVVYGQLVAYHPQGVPSKNPAIAVVLQLGMRGQITLRVLGNRMVVDAVPHIGDPRLVKKEGGRANGAWDLTDYDKDRIAQLRAVNDRISAVEEVVNQLSAVVDRSEIENLMSGVAAPDGDSGKGGNGS